MSFNIAIDGPAGAGKSTIAKRLAQELGFLYVDTGAMYRAIALYLLRNGVDCGEDKSMLHDGNTKMSDDADVNGEAKSTSGEQALREALDRIDISISHLDGAQQVFLNGENVTGLIRTEEVSQMASKSSAQPMVREKLLQLQRNIAKENDVLMDGRDIGTRILPQAQLKIFLTASPLARAKRRYEELIEKGQECTLEEIEREMEERDYRDTHRETAPLRQAEDAVCVDTSDMTIDEVVARIQELVNERRGLWK